MTITQMTFINGITLTFAQGAALFDYFCNQQDSCCAKKRLQANELQKYSMKDILNHYRDNSSTSSNIAEEDDDFVSDYYYDFLEAVEFDVKKLSLTFKPSYHDVHEKHDVIGVLGFSIQEANLEGKLTSVLNINALAAFDCRQVLLGAVQPVFGPEIANTITTCYSTYAVANDCNCCS
jgi:hypothetical protein